MKQEKKKERGYKKNQTLERSRTPEKTQYQNKPPHYK
jgi:hypothetical protein